ncbi:MAG: LUD domain-containing protein [Actinomycetota bacterium]|nr:LUD domain-containing protein [Actinomycetota bacterium]
MDHAVAAALARSGARRVLVPPGIQATWLPSATGAPFETDTGEPAATLEHYDAAISACAVAIAESGTVVLDGGSGQGRRALSLLPDHLIVVVRDDQVVDDADQALARLVPGTPQTWISGPSATSDIELQRVEGVHGPRRLDVIVIA